MKDTISHLLRRLRLLRFDFLTTRASALPDRSMMEAGNLTLVESGDIKKWACLKCPGDCGEVINLSLNPNQRPRWQVSEDFWLRPTIHPSVHQKNECGCHFWINSGQISWCKDGRPDHSTDCRHVIDRFKQRGRFWGMVMTSLMSEFDAKLPFGGSNFKDLA